MLKIQGFILVAAMSTAMLIVACSTDPAPKPGTVTQPNPKIDECPRADGEPCR